MNTVFNTIGKPVPQLEGRDKVRGLGIYTTDLSLHGMLFGAILRSPHPHAKIISINTSAAEAMAGVHAVVTGADTARQYIHTGPKFADRYPLAQDRVRFFGEEVAAVAAETLEQAQAAARKIVVEYEILPAVFDVEAALHSSAPTIHKLTDRPANIAQHTQADWGDVDAHMNAAEHRVDGVFSHGVVAPVCIETNAVVAHFHADENRIDIWAGTQAPFFARKEVAHVMDLPVGNVRVHDILIGGGFGGKSQATEPVAIAAFLSRRANRPVKIVLTRQEEFISGKTDHAKTMHLKTAVDSSGQITARHTDFKVDNGAFTHMGIAYVSAVRQRVANLYRVGSAGFDGDLVYTNKVPGGSYRGMGAPQIIWAIETQIDELAEKLGKDKLEYRKELANQPGDTTPQGFRISTCAMSECLDEVARAIGWHEKKAENHPWRGIGFAAMINPSVGILYPEGNFANIAFTLEEDGSFSLCTQTADCGTWQNTALAQCVAESLDLSVATINVVHMDTERGPDDLGSAASRVTFMSGQAALDAGRKMRSQIASRLSLIWNADSDSIEFRDNHVGLPDQEGRWLAWPEVASVVGSVKTEGFHQLDLKRSDPDTGYGHYAATYGFGAQAAEVEVDPETGHVRVLKVVCAIDIGRVINPMALDGQMAGGILQGIGMALSEELVFNDGRPVNTSMINYRVPRAVESPQIECIYVETNDPHGPFGAKAGGEHSINAAVGAVANAVRDATGITFRKLPLNPQRVRAAITTKLGQTLELQSWRRPYNLEVAAVRAAYPKGVFRSMQRVGKKFGRKKPVGKPYRIVVPDTLEEAIGMLEANPSDTKIIAGGTDILPGIRQGVYAAGTLIEIKQLKDLCFISADDENIRIGALSTLTQIVESEIVRQSVPALAEGLELAATRQIRNVATIAGDLCQEKRCWFFRSALPCYKNGGATCPCYAVTGDNRHHAILGAKRCAAPCIADAAPILVSLDAEIIAVGSEGRRAIPIEKFYRWSGETTLRKTEIIQSIAIPKKPGRSGVYEKYAQWRGDFPEVSAAVQIQRAAADIKDVRISVAGVAPLPERLTHSEQHVMRFGCSAKSIREAALKGVYGALPLRDNQAKCDMLVGVLERALQRCEGTASP